MKKHNKGGRPKMDSADKKSQLISVRLTEIELATIQAKAEMASKSVSDFIRELALKSEIKAGISNEQMDEIRKLNNIGNNLNQLAKLAHQNGYSEEIHFRHCGIMRKLNDFINQTTPTK